MNLKIERIKGLGKISKFYVGESVISQYQKKPQKNQQQQKTL